MKVFYEQTIVCISKSNTIKGEQIHFHIMKEKLRFMFGFVYDQYICCEKLYWSDIKNSFSWTLKCVSIQKPNEYKMMKCIQNPLFVFLFANKKTRAPPLLYNYNQVKDTTILCLKIVEQKDVRGCSEVGGQNPLNFIVPPLPKQGVSPAIFYSELFNVKQ